MRAFSVLLPCHRGHYVMQAARAQHNNARRQRYCAANNAHAAASLPQATRAPTGTSHTLTRKMRPVPVARRNRNVSVIATSIIYILARCMYTLRRQRERARDDGACRDGEAYLQLHSERCFHPFLCCTDATGTSGMVCNAAAQYAATHNAVSSTGSLTWGRRSTGIRKAHSNSNSNSNNNNSNNSNITTTTMQMVIILVRMKT